MVTSASVRRVTSVDTTDAGQPTRQVVPSTAKGGGAMVATFETAVAITVAVDSRPTSGGAQDIDVDETVRG